MSTDPFEYRTDPPLGLNWQSLDRISQRLKAAYEEVALEPVPDRFAELLEQLEQVETQSATNGGASSIDGMSSSNREHRQ